MTPHRVLCADPVLAVGARLGEGPGWDAEHGRLLWVDILGEQVHAYVPGDPPSTQRWSVGSHVGAVVPARGGELLLAVRDGLAALMAGGEVRLVRPVEADRPEHRMNDARCDPQGRLWAGTMPYRAAPGAGALYRMDTDGTVTRVLDQVSLSNGMGWSPDGATMYHIDSRTRRVDAYDFDGMNGCLGARRTVVRVDPTDGTPDGMAVDDEGCLWVALHGGGRLHRYRADGRLDTVVEVPVPKVTSCAFGGPGRDVLYITTGGGQHTAGEVAEPHAGDLFAVRPGTTGPGATPFAAVPSGLA